VAADFEPDPTVPPPPHPPEGWAAPADWQPGGSSPDADADGDSDTGVSAGPHFALRLKVELAVMLFATAAPGLVLGLRGLTDPESFDTDIAVLDLIATFFAALGPAAIATYLLWRDGRLSAAGFDRRPWRWTLGYGSLGAVCAVLALWTVGIIVFVMIAVVTGSDLPEEDTTGISLSVGSILAGILISVAAGVGEEIVYRAYAISRLEELGWYRAAVWAPWAVFTVQHLYEGPEAILFIGAVGGTFVWLYRWQRSVWPVVVAHILYDLFIILLLATV
jgi:membrane protease YdiL (CAAX protease family)